VLVLQRCPWHLLASGLCLSPQTQCVELTVWRFAERIIKASKGEKGIVEPTYIYLPGVVGGDAIAKEVGVDFFSVPVELGVIVNFIL
jgi:hypothetical protein